jgi:hypothetical protein
MPEGDLNYRYEDIFQQARDLQFKPGTRIRRPYDLHAGAPVTMRFYDPGSKETGYAQYYEGNPAQINCCGSTSGAVYLEMERKFRLSQTRGPVRSFSDLYSGSLEDKKKLPSHSGYELWIPLAGVDGLQYGNAKGVEKFGIGFGLKDPENLRRGDAVQIWWVGYPNLRGHNVFAWDVRIGDGKIEFQQLSGNVTPDGLGINYGPVYGARGFDPVDYQYLLNLLKLDNSWFRYRPGEKAVAGPPCHIPEIHVARFYRFFPYWPVHLGDVPEDRSGFGKDEDGDPLGQGGLLVGGEDGSGPAAIGEDIFANNEGFGDFPQRSGGFYPLGSNRTYHGGIHLYPKAAGAPVYAVSDGVIVAVRCPAKDAQLEKNPDLPSRNFVLIRHQVKLDGEEKVFYCLYMHLDAGQKEARLMESRWLWKLRNLSEDDPRRVRLERGDVVFMAEPVAAGDIVAHVAPPPKDGEPLLHWEIFSSGDKNPIATFSRKRAGLELFKQIEDNNQDLIIDNVKGSDELFALIAQEICTRPWYWGAVGDARGIITDEEISRFFHGHPRREDLRYYVCKHVSEWSATKIQWDKIPEKERWSWLGDSELEQKIKLYSWWTDDLGNHVSCNSGDKGLPKSHVVWTYHPVTFLAWLQEKVKDDPTGKQVEQDVKSFIATATRGGEPQKPKLWKIQKPDLAVFTDTTQGSQKLAGYRVVHYFQSLEEKTEDNSKFCRFSGWVKEVDGETRNVYENSDGMPGEVLQHVKKTPPDPKECCQIKGPLNPAGEKKDKDGTSFVSITGWVCVKSGTIDYAKPV